MLPYGDFVLATCVVSDDGFHRLFCGERRGSLERSDHLRSDSARFDADQSELRRQDPDWQLLEWRLPARRWMFTVT